jgi:hypothetical protein
MQAMFAVVVVFGGLISVLPFIHAIRSGEALVFFAVLGLTAAPVALIFLAPATYGITPAAILWAAGYLASVFADYTAGSDRRHEQKRQKTMREVPPVGQAQQAPRSR